jgi:hypothetical protein
MLIKAFIKIMGAAYKHLLYANPYMSFDFDSCESGGICGII